MKVFRASENEFDTRLELDRRKVNAAFFVRYDSESEVPTGFYEQQHQFRDGLQLKFWAEFDNNSAYVSKRPWESKSFFFNEDSFNFESIFVEIAVKILGDKLLHLVSSYLGESGSGYCLIVAVHTSMEREAGYLGRFAMNSKEIMIEESLAEIWSKQVSHFQ